MTAPGGAPAIVVADDGELSDVRTILEEVGAEFEDWHKGAVTGEFTEPSQLLVATVSRAITLGLRRRGERSPARPVWIAVLVDGSGVAGSPLLESGFDFLVRQPVHPAALRHLLTQALFRGDSRRRGTRVAVGYTVTVRVGLRRLGATLVDLSPRGCRVLLGHRLQEEQPVTLQFPAALAGGEAFAIRGWVLRLGRGELEGGNPSETSTSIRFDSLSRETKELLHALLNDLSKGPSQLVAAPGAGGARAPERRAPRAVFEAPVLVFGESDRVIVASDLCRDGMRVRSGSHLRVGDTVRLAIEAGARTEPVVVSGEVIRDDGASGLALRFGWVEPGGRERLDQLIAALPAVEARSPDDADPAPVTLSTVVPGLVRIGGEAGAAAARSGLASLVSRLCGKPRRG
jgi:hypothetical protein